MQFNDLTMGQTFMFDEPSINQAMEGKPDIMMRIHPGGYVWLDSGRETDILNDPQIMGRPVRLVSIVITRQDGTLIKRT